MPSSNSCSASSSGSSSASRRLTIDSSCWNDFSNSLDFLPSGLTRPDSLQPHRLSVNRAFEAALLELHFDLLADADLIRIEDRLASAARARERNRVAAREHRQRRDSFEMSRHGREPLPLLRDARRKSEQRRIRGIESAAKQFRARVEQAEQRHPSALQTVPVRADARLDHVLDPPHIRIDLHADLALCADHDLRSCGWCWCP